MAAIAANNLGISFLFCDSSDDVGEEGYDNSSCLVIFSREYFFRSFAHTYE